MTALTDDDREALRVLAAEGLTVDAIAWRLGLKRKVVSRRARTWGIALPPSPGARREAWWRDNHWLLAALVDAGLTAAAIAGEMGVTRNAVIGRLRRVGLKLARPGVGGRRRPETGDKINPFPPGGCCLFPSGDPGKADFGFCGAPTGGLAGPYCAEHRRIAYQPARPMGDVREAA